MSKWISVEKELPKLNLPVLCIVRTSCSCEHYVPTVLQRIIIPDIQEWQWVGDSPESGNWVVCQRRDIVQWQYIDRFPDQYEEGFDR